MVGPRSSSLGLHCSIVVPVDKVVKLKIVVSYVVPSCVIWKQVLKLDVVKVMFEPTAMPASEADRSHIVREYIRMMEENKGPTNQVLSTSIAPGL